MTGNMIMDYSLLILFLPLAAFVIQIFIGKRLPRQGDWVAIGAVVTTLILSIAMFTSMLIGQEPQFAQEASFTWVLLKLKWVFWLIILPLPCSWWWPSFQA